MVEISGLPVLPGASVRAVIVTIEVMSVPELVMANVDVPVMKSDYVAIKTAARVDPTLYFLKDGTIVDKFALHDAAEKYK